MFHSKTRYVATAVFSFAMLGTWVQWRLTNDAQFEFSAGNEKSFKGTKFDPRGYDLVEQIIKQRESESFKSRLRSGNSADLSWPGLASAQVSWTWLELLQGLHTESSYKGDFSWMFSKLNTVIKNSPKHEQRFVSALGAFFYAIGKDHAGANLLFQEMVKRSPEVYNTWFWGGFHAYYNLKMPKMAGDCFERAAKFPWAASYIGALAARLKYDVEALSAADRKTLIKKELDPEVLKKIKQSRPEWLE